MRLVIFGLVTAVFAIAVYVIALMIALSCGLGPDSPTACNAEADRDTYVFLAGAAFLYVALAFWFLRRGRSGVR